MSSAELETPALFSLVISLFLFDVIIDAVVLGEAIAVAERMEEQGLVDGVTCTAVAQRLYSSAIFQFEAVTNGSPTADTISCRSEHELDQRFNVSFPKQGDTDILPVA